MNPPTIIAEFPYRVRWPITLFVIVMFGSCSIFLGNKALTNGRGLVINRVIELGPEGANVFFCVLGALSLLFTLVGIGAAVQRVFRPMRIAFTPEGIIAPLGPLSATETFIPYPEIAGIRTSRRNSQDFIHIIRTSGKYTIYGIRLTSAEAVQEVAQRILYMCPQLQSPS